MQRAFVTGGSGFVGRALIAELVRRGVGVRGLARSDAAASTVGGLGAEVVRGDLSDRDVLQAGMKGCDVVFHAAAYLEDPGVRTAAMAINVDGTRNALAAARGAGVRRFVHVGTEAVLADGNPIVRADETRPRTSRPAGLYPETKGLAEAAVVAASGAGLDTIVIRPRFIWGRGDTSLMPKLLAAVKAGTFAWIGGGRYLTSTCHIDNVVEGALLAAERGKAGEIYFLTDGEPVEFRTFMTDMFRTQGVDPGKRSVPRWLIKLIVKSTQWMTRPPVSATALALVGNEVTVNDAKARRELGYVGAKDRATGLAEMRSDGAVPGPARVPAAPAISAT
jgi:nucleoside-diphosphate-sugar epimerase